MPAVTVEKLDPVQDYEAKSGPAAPEYTGRSNGVMFSEGVGFIRGLSKNASEDDKRLHREKLAWFLDQGYRLTPSKRPGAEE